MPHDIPSLPRARSAFDARRYDHAIDAALLVSTGDGCGAERAEALVLCGRAFAARGDFDDALDVLDRALGIAPGDSDAHCWRGWCYFRQGRGQLARLDFDRAIELDGDNGRAYLHRGLLLRAAGDHRFAIADFDRVAGDDQVGVEALMHRGLSRLDSGDRTRARADLVAAARQGSPRAGGWLDHHFDVDDPVALIAVARHYRFSGTPNPGLGAIGRALAIGFDSDDDLLAALIENGHLHNAARQWSNALEAFDQAYELCPADRDAETYRARALYNVERDDEAESAYTGALRAHPDDNRLHRFYGELLMVSGRTAEAITALSAAIDADPYDAASWFQRGVCHHELGRDKARRDLLEAGRLGDRRATERRRADYGLDTGDDHLDAATTALDHGDFIAALDHLDAAVELLGAETRAPGDRAYRHLTTAMTNRGYALVRMGRHRDAIDTLAAATAMRPSLADPWHVLGNAFAADARYDDALDAFGRFIALRPDHPDGFYNRARVHHLRGDAGSAIADLDAAIEIGYRDDGQLVDAVFNRARANHSAGRLAAALADYEWLDALGYAPAPRLADSLVAIIDHDGARAAAGEHPFRFYGNQPADWEVGSNASHRYRLVFRDPPDSETRARIAEAFESACAGRVDTTRGAWRWSGRFAALVVGEHRIGEQDDHFDAVEDVTRAIHAVCPLAEVVYLDARAASFGDPWERWTIARQAVPTAAPRFGDVAALWVDAPRDVRDFDPITNDDAFEQARRDARKRCARARAVALAGAALEAGDIALVPIARDQVPPTMDALPEAIAGSLRDADVARVAANGAGIIMRRVGGYYRALDRITSGGVVVPVEIHAGSLAGPSVRFDGAVAAIAMGRSIYEVDLATGALRRVMELDATADNTIESTAYVGTDRIAAQTRSRMLLVQRGAGDDGGTVVSSRPCASGFTTSYRDGAILIAATFSNPTAYVYAADGNTLTTLAVLRTELNAYTVRVAGDRVVARGPAGDLELRNIPRNKL